MSRSYTKKRYREHTSEVKKEAKNINSRTKRRYAKQFCNQLIGYPEKEIIESPNFNSYYFGKYCGYNLRRKRIDEIIKKNIHKNTICREKYKKDILGLLLDIVKDIKQEQKTFYK